MTSVTFAKFDGNNNPFSNDDQHEQFDLVIIVFIAFVMLMMMIHCYLKRQERIRIKKNMYENLSYVGSPSGSAMERRDSVKDATRRASITDNEELGNLLRKEKRAEDLG